MVQKRFRSKKNVHFSFFAKVLFFFFLIYISYVFTFRFLFRNFMKEKANDEAFMGYLLHHSMNYTLEGYDSFSEYLQLHFKNPSFLLQYSLDHIVDDVFLETEEKETLGVQSEYVKDPNPTVISKPLVYIYNTHQTEGFSYASLETYNVKPNIMMVSYVLRERLNDLGVPTIVETGNIEELLRTQNWTYSYSYQASRILLDDAKEKNPSLRFFIDLHRDSSIRSATTTEIDGKNYAKILFVVGKGNTNYEKNLAVANTLNDAIKKENPSLSRGVISKGVLGVSGIYNQDFDPQTVLIELGGQYNTIEEATNTIGILSEILANYVKENL